MEKLNIASSASSATNVTPSALPSSVSKKVSKKTKGDVFQETLRAWCDAQEKAHADAKEILSKGPVLLAPYLFGQGGYFIISQELNLYPVRAFIRDGDVYVSATLRKDEPQNDEYILDWEDLSHDIPTINDFMSALYESAGEAEHEE